jgi:hypothetical protein
MADPIDIDKVLPFSLSPPPSLPRSVFSFSMFQVIIMSKKNGNAKCERCVIYCRQGKTFFLGFLNQPQILVWEYTCVRRLRCRPIPFPSAPATPVQLRVPRGRRRASRRNQRVSSVLRRRDMADREAAQGIKTDSVLLSA